MDARIFSVSIQDLATSDLGNDFFSFYQLSVTQDILDAVPELRPFEGLADEVVTE